MHCGCRYVICEPVFWYHGSVLLHHLELVSYIMHVYGCIVQDSSSSCDVIHCSILFCSFVIRTPYAIYVCVSFCWATKKKTKTCIYFSWTKIYLLACFNILTVFFIAMHSAQALLLGFQHYILTLGMTVLIPTVIVPEMGGGHVNNFFLPFIFFFKF